MIFRKNYTKERYQETRNEAVERNYGHCYPTYDAIRDYRKKYCRPVIYSDKNMTWSEVQANANHQLGRQFELDPALEALCIARAITGHDLTFYIKWGMGKE